MKTTLLFLCLLAPGALWAQDSLSFSPGPRTGIIASTVLYDPSGQSPFCVCLRTNRDSVVYLLTDSAFHVLGQFGEPWSAPTNLLLVERARPVGAATYRDSVFHQYFAISPPGLPAF